MKIRVQVLIQNGLIGTEHRGIKGSGWEEKVDLILALVQQAHKKKRLKHLSWVVVDTVARTVKPALAPRGHINIEGSQS